MSSGAAATPSNHREPPARELFRWWLSIPIRWMDGDPYGHVNNAQYHSFIDTVVTSALWERGVLGGRLWSGRGLAVETHCAFFSPISFPSTVDGGLRVGHIGRSSVRYEVGLFNPGKMQAAAFGYLVHVYVDPQTNRPMPLADAVRAALTALGQC
jgi:acyl-CoA thioester hydrolase